MGKSLLWLLMLFLFVTGLTACDEKTSPVIVEVENVAIEVSYGTESNEVIGDYLPARVNVKLSDQTEGEADVIWEADSSYQLPGKRAR